MPASYTSGQRSNSRRYPTCWASSQRKHTISRTPCHGAWTSAPLSAHPTIECCCTASQIKIPICTLRTAIHQFFWQQQHTWGAVDGSSMERGVADNSTRLRTLIPDTGTHIPGMTLPRRAWVPLNRLRTGVGRFRSWLYKWGMSSYAACECGTEEQTVDHIVLQCPINQPPTDCTAWRFWTMKQPNGCSTSAPNSSAAKQWVKEELAQTKEVVVLVLTMPKAIFVLRSAYLYRKIKTLRVSGLFFCSWFHSHCKRQAHWIISCAFWRNKTFFNSPSFW